jgi:hypothetical protein
VAPCEIVFLFITKIKYTFALAGMESICPTNKSFLKQKAAASIMRQPLLICLLFIYFFKGAYFFNQIAKRRFTQNLAAVYLLRNSGNKIIVVS